MTSRWISLVPSPIVVSFTSRKNFSAVVLDEPVATMNLDPVLGDMHRRFAGEQLGHRRLAGGHAAPILEIGGAVGQPSRRLDPGCHVGQLELYRLKRRDRLSKLFTLGRVASRGLVRTLCEPDRQRGNPDPAGVEHPQHLHEPLLNRPE